MEVNLQSPPNCILEDYRISALRLVANSSDFKKELLDVECMFCCVGEDTEKYQIKLRISYQVKAQTPISLDILATGDFLWRGGYEARDGDSYLAWVNGGTILYGLMRSTIAELTASSECGRVLLPTVMMRDIVDETINNLKQTSADKEVEVASNDEV